MEKLLIGTNLRLNSHNKVKACSKSLRFIYEHILGEHSLMFCWSFWSCCTNVGLRKLDLHTAIHFWYWCTSMYVCGTYLPEERQGNKGIVLGSRKRKIVSWICRRGFYMRCWWRATPHTLELIGTKIGCVIDLDMHFISTFQRFFFFVLGF